MANENETRHGTRHGGWSTGRVCVGDQSYKERPPVSPIGYRPGDDIIGLSSDRRNPVERPSESLSSFVIRRVAVTVDADVVYVFVADMHTLCCGSRDEWIPSRFLAFVCLCAV